MNVVFEWLFWSSAGMVVLITAGYPICLALYWAVTSPASRKAVAPLSYQPHVSLIIAAYNEEASIAAKLENTLALDYPRDRLDIFVASDGSTDGTNEIVAAYGGRGVKLVDFPRTGKTGMQNRMAARVDGEVLVFSDANAAYRPDAIGKLVRHFADPAIGAVCGELVYKVEDAAGAGTSERTYWDYEKFMKRRESELSSVIGANGSIYAVRRTDYVQIDDGLISDLVEPLAIVRNGKRVVYEPEAISEEEASTSYGVEFRRKVRILTRSILGLLSMKALFNPFRFGVFSLQLFMHKLLRFLTPLFIIVGAASLAALAAGGRYQLLFAISLVAVFMAVAVGRGSHSRRRNPFARICHLLYYYLMVNSALVLAWINVARGKRMKLWSPERKTG